MRNLGKAAALDEASQKTCHDVLACCTLPADREEAQEIDSQAARCWRAVASSVSSSIRLRVVLV